MGGFGSSTGRINIVQQVRCSRDCQGGGTLAGCNVHPCCFGPCMLFSMVSSPRSLLSRCSPHPTPQINHDGEVNRARYCPQVRAVPTGAADSMYCAAPQQCLSLLARPLSLFCLTPFGPVIDFHFTHPNPCVPPSLFHHNFSFTTNCRTTSSSPPRPSARRCTCLTTPSTPPSPRQVHLNCLVCVGELAVAWLPTCGLEPLVSIAYLLQLCLARFSSLIPPRSAHL